MNKKKILIIGNGFGGIYTLKYLHKIFHGKNNIEISMVGNKNYFLFTPLLHEIATGGIDEGNIIEPVRTIFSCCLKNFYLGDAKEIDTKNKVVRVRNCDIPYDYLVLALGAQTNFYNIPGAEKYSFPLKSTEHAINIKNHIIKQIECALYTKDEEGQKQKLTFVVVGGGPTGVELVAELQELIQQNFSKYYSKGIIKKVSIILIQKANELIPQFNTKIRRKTLAILEKKNIRVLLNKEVTSVNENFIEINGGEKINTGTVIWVAGIKPNEIEFKDNVEKLKSGHLVVDEFLKLIGQKNVFAIGDMSAFKDKNSGNYLPALAQVAEKEAEYIAKNIYLGINKKPMESFEYKSSGALISVGQWMALGEISNFTFYGRITWWIWRTIYLFKLISNRKKLRVAFDWTLNLFYPRDISQY